MRFFDDWNTRRRIRSTGQALILIVLTFMGLLLFLGLMIDLGQIFLAKGYLRRAADAGALAAAAQFRENRTMDEMIAAAREVVNINGVDPTNIEVRTCKDGYPGPDGTLCSPVGKMPKKLVKVTVEMDYPLTFLTLLNIYSVHLTETSISEAAAMDVVLVIDVSESMTWDGAAGATYDVDERNPQVCNATSTCKPFMSVKTAAEDFAYRILDKTDPTEEQDRLAIVTFANGWQDGDLGTIVKMSWTNKYSVASPIIASLNVYDAGGEICPYGKWGCPSGSACPADVNSIPTGSCLYISDLDQYGGMHCARTIDIETADGDKWDAKDEAISACNTTNIGGGLRRAGEQFAVEKRPDALWVVVLLTDGAANATFGIDADVTLGGGINVIYPPQDPLDFIPNLPYGFCPDGTWLKNGSYCQDGDVDTRHNLTSPPGLYDADDFARDQAKFVACWANNPAASCGGTMGQGAVVFTIGLGDKILDLDDNTNGEADGKKPYGESLLRYIAAIGDDGDSATDSCDGVPSGKSCGNYFFAKLATDLDHVFEMIYSRIFTRLTQ